MTAVIRDGEEGRFASPEVWRRGRGGSIMVPELSERQAPMAKSPRQPLVTLGWQTWSVVAAILVLLLLAAVFLVTW